MKAIMDRCDVLELCLREMATNVVDDHHAKSFGKLAWETVQELRTISEVIPTPLSGDLRLAQLTYMYACLMEALRNHRNGQDDRADEKLADAERAMLRIIGESDSNRPPPARIITLP